MDQTAPKMEYRNLGPSGLKVSVLGFGTGIPCDDPNLQERITSMVKRGYELGINFFDTAERYLNGKSEIMLGNAFKELNLPREQLVVTTKIFFGGNGPNDVGLSRKHIIEGTKNSLKRLQLDYVDVIYCHTADFKTPVEETCRAFDYIINQGKAFYWGTSNWPADRIVEAYRICDVLGLHRPIVEQVEYSMLVRERFEKEYERLFSEQKMGGTIYSPLAGGVLSGKYNEGIPEGSRFDTSSPGLLGLFNKYFSEDKKGKTLEAFKVLSGIAKELGCSQAQLAYAWTLTNPNVNVCIFGATKMTQFEENFKALEVYQKLTPEILKRIENVLGNKP